MHDPWIGNLENVPKSEYNPGLNARNNAMIARQFYCIAASLLVYSGISLAQNAISFRSCVLEPAKTSGKDVEGESYVLRLELRCTLTSENHASLKVAVDSKETGNFQTVAEERLRRGRGIPLEFEIPITDWKTEKLSVFLVMQRKDAQPDDIPLATVTKSIEKTSLKKE